MTTHELTVLNNVLRLLGIANVPLIHSSHRGATCYMCQPEMRDVPLKGKCPKCETDAESAKSAGRSN